MSRDQIPPPLSGQERHEALERDYTREDAYWARIDREDRHAPAPETYFFCDIHGWHRFILGCDKCGKKP